MKRFCCAMLLIVIFLAGCLGDTPPVSGEPLASVGPSGGGGPTISGPGGEDVDNMEDGRFVVSEIVTKNGRNYVEYLGNPYLIYGVQNRMDYVYHDPLRDMSVYEELWEKTAEMGFRTIEMQAWWQFIEPEKDVYDFFDLDQAIKWCDKYDLNMQLIWFSFVAGGTGVPGYIMSDPETYPRSELSPSVAGASPALIERECKAVEALMDFIKENDTNHRVMMIQLDAEQDTASSGVDWNDLESVSKFGWMGGQSDGLIDMMNQMGLAVKASDRPIVTRVAFTDMVYRNPFDQQYDYMRRIFALPGVDMVGIDNYSAKLSYQNELMDYLEGLIPENIAYQPETGPEQGTFISRALLAFSRANGFLTYELRLSNANYPDWLDGGFYRKSVTEWIERDGTAKVPVYPGLAQGDLWESITSEVREFNKTIYKASHRIASLPKDNLTAFNLQEFDMTKAPDRTRNLPCGSYTLSCYSPQNKQGFAMCDLNGDLILLGFGPTTQYTVEGKTLSGSASIGYFTDTGAWVEESTASLSGSTVMVYAGQCLVIPESGIN